MDKQNFSLEETGPKYWTTKLDTQIPRFPFNLVQPLWFV